MWYLTILSDIERVYKFKTIEELLEYYDAMHFPSVIIQFKQR